jgi:hypothetical protein
MWYSPFTLDSYYKLWNCEISGTVLETVPVM